MQVDEQYAEIRAIDQVAVKNTQGLTYANRHKCQKVEAKIKVKSYAWSLFVVGLGVLA